jgi:peroxiredoxin
MELFNPRTGRVETFALKAEKTLLFFVSGGDCPACLDERRIWDKLGRAADGKRFDVVGILVRTSPGEAHTLVKAYNPQFTLLLDSENRIAQRTELPQLTPFKFLVNQHGEILMTDGPNNKRSAQEAFGEKVAVQIGLAQAVR